MQEDRRYDFPWSLRHISALQVRNFTPFPLRDTVTSTLSRSPVHLAFSVDDLQFESSKKRGRKYSDSSQASITTNADISTSPASSSRLSISSRRGTVRQHARRRASSLDLGHSASYTSILPDYTESTLQRVISSRLVDTFLTATVIDSSPPSPTTLAQQRGRKKPSTDTSSAPPTPADTCITPDGSSSKLHHLRGIDTAPPSPNFDRTFSTHPTSFTSFPSRHNSPNYISPIHNPSTNPKFMVDASTGSSFAPWTEPNARTFLVELWGDISEKYPSAQFMKGKEPQRQPEDDVKSWRLLDHWQLDLDTLQPVPRELDDSQANLPCNTLVIYHLNGTPFYAPQSSPHATKTAQKRRSLSSLFVHDSGYSSDPASEVRTPAAADGDITPTPDHLMSRKRHRKRNPNGELLHSGDITPGVLRPPEPEGLALSSSWSDLFKLVSLQSSIADYQASLNAVVTGIDHFVQSNTMPSLEREISERTLQLSEMRLDRDKVVRETEDLRQSLAVRRAQLTERRTALAQAWALPEDLSEGDELVATERAHLTSLHSQFAPTRTSLFATLLSIYPIELLSPPDLLYTILSVPLPIPLSSRDPAPPLVIPKVSIDPDATDKYDAQQILSFRGVSDEDKIATALGYAAHVVQLLAVYLNKGLVYPITYAGSRTLIRDGISAMVGPRMFPLYSKGVDSYRYEYGVFLLNKDIELLMSDRDLTAIDIRNTLPNLKNLLLTLTSGEAVIPRRFSTLSLGSVSSLGVERDGVKSSDVSPEALGDSSESTDKTTSTPTASFLGMTSFSSGFGFLKKASSGSNAKEVSLKNGEHHHQADGEEGEEENEEDRRTLRAADGVVSSESANGSATVADVEKKMAPKNTTTPLIRVDARTPPTL